MIDIQLLRSSLDATVARLKTRGYALDTVAFLALESRRKAIQTTTESLQAQRNALSKQVGQAKAKGRLTHRRSLSGRMEQSHSPSYPRSASR